MRKGFDDTRVREGGLERSPLYRTFSSAEFSILLMLLIGVATLIAALFPQGMDEPFYVARFGERLYRIYDSLGLLGVLKSWWFLLLFLLLFVALIVCSYARVREGRPRGTKGTRLYETGFSVPSSTDDVLLIFPVLLSSMGFRKRRVIAGEGRWEVLAERGIHPSTSSIFLHLSGVLLLLGLLLTYVFSWESSVSLEAGNPNAVPLRGGRSRWAVFTGEQSSGPAELRQQESLGLVLCSLTRYYGPRPGTLTVAPDSFFERPGTIPAEQLLVNEQGRNLLLRGWKSRLSVMKGKKTGTLDVSSGESKAALGLEFSQGNISRTARVAFPALGETIQVTLPRNLRFDEAHVAAILPGESAVGRIFRLESAGALGQGGVRIEGRAFFENEDSVVVPREYTSDLKVGQEAQIGELRIKVLSVSDWSLIRVRSDPGRRLVKLGAVLIFLFTMIRLYMYCYVLRVEISAAKAGASHLRIRMRTSGLLASPAGVAQRIAELLSK